MIYRLSNILRRLLRKTESFSPLREEIRFIDDYLGLRWFASGTSCRFYKEVDEKTLDRMVPSMILQPIIENSIKHGLANKIDGGTHLASDLAGWFPAAHRCRRRRGRNRRGKAGRLIQSGASESAT